MATSPNKFSQFWQELKRRNVVRVITVYAGAAFVLLELVDMGSEPFGLPAWTFKLAVVILAIGLVVAIILSWIYDIHPEGGMVKTKPAKKSKLEDIPKSSNSWKIASYISFVVIVGLILWNILAAPDREGNSNELEKSIAVLPFNNFSTESGQESMCLGLTNEIINHLYKIRSFEKVSSFTSVMSYRDSFNRPDEIAKDLNVNYILQGSYTKVGSDLRVTAELIEKGSDTYIWQREYNRPYEEIISIQADIALQIASQINAFITVDEKERIQFIPTTDQEAYELLQEAIIIFESGSGIIPDPENFIKTLEKSISLALQAADLDPGYADAYAWAGVFILYQGVYVGIKEITLAAWEALPHLDKAIELDPECSMAHFVAGNIHEWVEWDYVKAEEAYKRVNLLEPNRPMNYSLLAEFYLKMNRLESMPSILETESTLAANTAKALVLRGERSASESMSDSMMSDAIVLGDWASLPYIAEGYIWAEEYDSAYSCINRVLDQGNIDITIPRFQASLALIYNKSSAHMRADSIIDMLKRRSQLTSAGSPAYFTGWYYSWTGEIDSAFVWLEKAYKNRSPEMPWLKVDPAFNNLKDDPHYWDLYARTGHKAYDDYMASKKKF